MSQYQYNQQTPAYGQQNRYQGQGYQSMDYNVDMVFCIDATGSMEDYGGGQKRLINMVKEGALNFYYDFGKVMQSKNKHVNQLRIRVIAFRDYLADGDEAMLVTDFFNLPQQAEDFQNCINSIDAMGGGDIPEDGLEALAYAIRSNWTTSGTKRRQVIVLWTDADPHPLQYGSAAPNYPKGMPRDLGELTEWWDEYMHPNFKRLVMFAPDEGGWQYISSNWENVVHFPSEAGNGLAEKGYSDILNVVANSV
jgi:hypothetical protein